MGGLSLCLVCKDGPNIRAVTEYTWKFSSFLGEAFLLHFFRTLINQTHSLQSGQGVPFA